MALNSPLGGDNNDFVKPEQTKELGKIENVYFGILDGRLGLHFTFKFSNGGRGVMWSDWTWDFNQIKHTENCAWTEDDRLQEASKIMKKVSDLLRDCKVEDISQLKNKPVELSFEGSMLRSYRILTEVTF